MNQILIVDDEPEIRMLIRMHLEREGMQITEAESGRQAIARLQEHHIALVILDIMMDDGNGFEVLHYLQETNAQTLVIALSARREVQDKIAALGLGADDYVTKPFNPLELMARIKSQLRRYHQFSGPNQPQMDENEIEIDELIINISTHQVTIEGQEVQLTPREFAILKLLAINQGIVLSMEKIYQEVWNEPFMESKNTVMVHIRRIREKIEKDTQNPKFIKTVWGIGYKMERL